MAGPDVPTDPEALAEAAERTAVFARVTPEQKQALVQALDRQRPLRRDGRRRRQRRAGDEGGPHLDRARQRLADRQGRLRHRARQRRLPLDPARHRRGPAHPLQHPPGGEAVRRQVGVRGDADPDRRARRLGLPAAAPPPLAGGAVHRRHPVVRARARALARPAAEPRLRQGPAALLRPRRRRLGARGAGGLRRDEEPAGPHAGGRAHRRRDRAGADRPVPHPAARGRGHRAVAASARWASPC